MRPRKTCPTAAPGAGPSAGPYRSAPGPSFGRPRRGGARLICCSTPRQARTCASSSRPAPALMCAWRRPGAKAEDAQAARDELQAQLGDVGGSVDELAPDERPRRVADLAGLVTAILGERPRGCDGRPPCAPSPRPGKNARPASRPCRHGRARLSCSKGHDGRHPPRTSAQMDGRGGRTWSASLPPWTTKTARLSTLLKRQEAEAATIASTRSLLSAEATDALRAARDHAWAPPQIQSRSRLRPDLRDCHAGVRHSHGQAHQPSGRRRQVERMRVQIAVHQADLEAVALARSRLEADRTDL